MNDETMMNVVDIYEVHHLTVEMTLKDRQGASMFGEFLRRKIETMPKLKNVNI